MKKFLVALTLLSAVSFATPIQVDARHHYTDEKLQQIAAYEDYERQQRYWEEQRRQEEEEPYYYHH